MFVCHKTCKSFNLCESDPQFVSRKIFRLLGTVYENLFHNFIKTFIVFTVSYNFGISCSGQIYEMELLGLKCIDFPKISNLQKFLDGTYLYEQLFSLVKISWKLQLTNTRLSSVIKLVWNGKSDQKWDRMFPNWVTKLYFLNSDLRLTRLRAGRYRVRIPVGARDFSLFQNVQTGTGAHPASSSG